MKDENTVQAKVFLEPEEEVLLSSARMFLVLVTDPNLIKSKNKYGKLVLSLLINELKRDKESDLPDPRDFVPDSQWKNEDLIYDDQMMTICGEIIRTLQERMDTRIKRSG